ncbi:MAG: FecR family protein [Deltaproteobacteria bacterium]|nr:FecR family protein [Deltaproteobacteria bacterium]
MNFPDVFFGYVLRVVLLSLLLFSGSGPATAKQNDPADNSSAHKGGSLYPPAEIIDVGLYALAEDPVYILTPILLSWKDEVCEVAGEADFEKAELLIMRFGSPFRATLSPAVIMKEDQLITSKDQKAKLRLRSGDLVLIKADSRFKINEFNLPKYDKEESVSFSLIGDIRAKIAKRKKMGRIRFRTTTAVIGIKGTDFDLQADEKGTQVATIEGVVGVSDPEGKTEVLVEEGMQTKVEKGKPPQKAEKIPAERLKALQSETMDVRPETADTGLWLKPPGLLDQFRLIEGKGFEIGFNEPLTEIAVVFKGEKVSAEIKDEGNKVIIDPEEIFKLAEGAKRAEIEIKAKSRSLDVSLKKTIRLVGKPQEPPKLIIGDGKNRIWLQPEAEIIVSADRDRVSWEAFVDGDKLSIEGMDASGDSSADDPGALSKEKQTDQTHLKLSKEIFERLKEGEHQLRVIARDDFSLSGEKTATLIVDHAPPVLRAVEVRILPADGDQTADTASLKPRPKEIPPPRPDQGDLKENPVLKEVKFGTIKIKEGESLVTRWSEPLWSVELSLKEIKRPLSLNQGKTEAILDQNIIRELFGKAREGELQVTAVDLNGNRKEIVGQIRFEPRPDSPPKLNLMGGIKEIDQEKLKDLVIVSDRLIMRWEAVLNQKALSIMPEEGLYKPAKKFVLQRKKILNLTGGDNLLVITGFDEFGLKDEFSLKIRGEEVKPDLQADHPLRRPGMSQKVETGLENRKNFKDSVLLKVPDLVGHTLIQSQSDLVYSGVKAPANLELKVRFKSEAERIQDKKKQDILEKGDPAGLNPFGAD